MPVRCFSGRGIDVVPVLHYWDLFSLVGPTHVVCRARGPLATTVGILGLGGCCKFAPWRLSCVRACLRAYRYRYRVPERDVWKHFRVSSLEHDVNADCYKNMTRKTAQRYRMGTTKARLVCRRCCKNFFAPTVFILL